MADELLNIFNKISHDNSILLTKAKTALCHDYETTDAQPTATAMASTRTFFKSLTTVAKLDYLLGDDVTTLQTEVTASGLTVGKKTIINDILNLAV